MEFRKLISFGRGSYIISIPKKWITSNKLKKGDLISVNDNKHELVISSNLSETKKEPKQITIDARNKDIKLLKSEIISSYLNAYDTIEILKDVKTNSQAIKDVLRNFTGMEIVEHSSTRIVSKDLINIKEVSIPTLIRRMDMTTRGMIDDAIKCIDKPEDHSSIADRDKDVNRLYYLTIRVVKAAMKNPAIMKSFDMDSWSLHHSVYMVTRLEKIADRQKRIARNLAQITLGTKEKEELKKVYLNLNQAYLDAMKVYYTDDKEKAHKLHINIHDHIAQCNDFLEKYSRYCKHFKKKEKIREMYCVSKSEIIENLKAMASSIKYIARGILERE